MLKLYLDENVPTVLAEQLRRRGFDAVSAHEVGMLHQADEFQLQYATRNGRALLTFDPDFFPLAIQWMSEGRHHSGIVFSNEIKMRDMGQLVNLCSRFISRVPTEEAADQVFLLQQFTG